MRKIGVDFALIRLVDDQLANIVVADRIAQRAVGRRILVGSTYPQQHPVADPAVVLRPEGQQGRYGEGPDKYDSFHNSVSIRFLRTEVIQTVLGSTKIVQAEGKNKLVCILPRRSLSKRGLSPQSRASRAQRQAEFAVLPRRSLSKRKIIISPYRAKAQKYRNCHSPRPITLKESRDLAPVDSENNTRTV